MMRKSVAGVAIVRRCAMVGADESRAAGIRVRLYSFPLCSVTEPYWSSLDPLGSSFRGGTPAKRCENKRRKSAFQGWSRDS
jgi:hypothetical protein